MRHYLKENLLNIKKNTKNRNQTTHLKLQKINIQNTLPKVIGISTGKWVKN